MGPREGLKNGLPLPSGPSNRRGPPVAVKRKLFEDLLALADAELIVAE